MADDKYARGYQASLQKQGRLK